MKLCGIDVVWDSEHKTFLAASWPRVESTEAESNESDCISQCTCINEINASNLLLVCLLS